MRNRFISSKSAIAPLVLIVIAIIAVAGIAAGAYVLTQQPAGPSASPTPTPTPTHSSGTATPIPTFAFPTPTPAQATANFRVGAYAHYTVILYLSGSPMQTTTVKLTVDSEENYEGTSCWVYTMSSQMQSSSLEIKTTRWLSKSTLQCLHIRVHTYQNGDLIDDQEYEGDSHEGSEMPNLIETRVGYETITVTAGTFESCSKGVTGGSTGSITVESRDWTHPTVPIWGLVKMETLSSGELVSSYELTAYGG